MGGIDKTPTNKPVPVILPADQQQPALDVETIKGLNTILQTALSKSTEKITDPKAIESIKKSYNNTNLSAGAKLGGDMEIKKGSIFSYTNSSLRGQMNSDTKQWENIRTSSTYTDNDGNGTFETLKITKNNVDKNGKVISSKTTLYGKSKDDNVSPYDQLIPPDETAK